MQQADAADEVAVKGICEQATKEEGRLDVFFANVCRIVAPGVTVNEHPTGRICFETTPS